MADPVGSVYIELAASTARFMADMEKVRAKLGKVGKDADTFSIDFAKAGKAAAAGIAAVGAAAAAVGTAILAVTKSYANSGDELAKMSVRTGESVEQLSALREIGKLADVEMQSLQKAYKELSVKAFEASQGSREQKETFELLNIAVKDSRGELRPAGDLMLEVADRISTMTNMTERATIINRLFGKAGLDLLPMLEQGSAAMRAQAKEVEQLGVMWSTKAAKAAELFNDNLTRLGIIAEGVRNIIGEAFLPVLNDLVEGVLSWWKANEKVLKQHMREWAEGAAEKLRELAGHAKDISGALQTMHQLWADLKALGIPQFISAVVRAIWNMTQMLLDVAVLMVQQFAISFMKPFAMLPGFIGRKAQEMIDEWEAGQQDWKASMERNVREMFQAMGVLQDDSNQQELKKHDEQTGKVLKKQDKRNSQSLLKALEHKKRMQELFGEQLFREERQSVQPDRGSMDFQFDPKLGAEQVYVTKRLTELMPELEGHEANLLALHNQEVGTGIVDQERMRAQLAQERITSLKDETALQQASFDLQTAFYNNAPGLIGQADFAREAGMRLFEAQEQERLAILDEQLKQGTLLWQDYYNEVTKLDMEMQGKRMDLVRQFPTFWEQQLQSLVQSNVFSMGQIVSTWSSSIAQGLVKWDSFTSVIKSAWEQTQIAVVQAALNALVQWGAQVALAASRELGLQTALTAAKATLFGTETTAKAAAVAAGSKVEAAGAASSLSNIAAVGAAATAMGTTVVTMTSGIFAAIAAALGATVVGSPLAPPFAAAAAAIASVGGAAVAAGAAAQLASVTGAGAALAGMAAIPMAQGGSGMVTQPTLFLAGEAGPEHFSFTPMGGGGLEKQQPIVIHLQTNIDGRVAAEQIVEPLIPALRMRGVPV